jgi:hypothetical protein
MSNTDTDALVPVAWQDVHDPTDLYWREPVQAETRPLYGPDTIERLSRERDEAVARERERCAQLCESRMRREGTIGRQLALKECAEAIRTTKATT